MERSFVDYQFRSGGPPLSYEFICVLEIPFTCGKSISPRHLLGCYVPRVFGVAILREVGYYPLLHR